MAEASQSRPHPDSARNGRAVLEMVGAALCFATMSAVAHGLRGDVAWPVVAFARILVTFCMVLVVAAYYGAPLRFLAPRAMWARSLFGSMGLLCTFYSISRLHVTDAVTIFSTGPVWITVILVVVFRQAMPRSVWFHAFLALAGVYVMHRPTFSAESFPLLVALLGAVAAASAKVSLSFLSGQNTLAVVAHYSGCATLVSLAMCFAATDRIVLAADMNPLVWGWLLPMGLAGTCAQVLMTMAYRRGKTTLVALAGLSQIAFAAVFDLVLWGHRLDAWKAVGVLMIAAAIALSVRTHARSRAKSQPE